MDTANNGRVVIMNFTGVYDWERFPMSGITRGWIARI